ncbi:MAG: thioredoxin domain-containing protein [Desulfobacteraceae bacterium]|nr:thioredoxin domain-containing protein [Desulfobacteraceae bacterium]
MTSGSTLDSGAHLAELLAIDKNSLPADGGERFNRLIFARSPYLLQHAENPVDWYEWGQEAFELARRESRPILLSIGYATCHWCHVMAHESFEDNEVAGLLNRHFVCIKVDREERPDIDDFYMTVAQVLTGSGGWPLNIFMTPDKRPFFAMTYLPKHDRQGMRGLTGLLGNIATLWRQQPDKIENNCDAIMETLENIAQPIPQELSDLDELNQDALEQLSSIYDKDLGGFGTSPKFPMPINLSWLIEQGAAGNSEALDMALFTLRMMRCGGIWDQLGGGLHRYSVDQKWLVPHFEKMLYDQAMLALVSLEAFQASSDTFFLDTALGIFGFVAADLTSPQGGFYSALDADSEGEEGTFYLWTKEEIDTILGADAALFCRLYDVSSYGNFEGRTILNIPTDIAHFSANDDPDLDTIEQTLEACCERLLEQRNKRIHPLRDEKVITAWNGLMIAALAKGGAITGSQLFIERAARAADFILQNLRRTDGRLLRSYMGGPSDIPGFLEDYAFFTHGLIELFEATLDQSWQDTALHLADETLRLFYDRGAGEFTKTGADAEQMPVRASLEHDGVLPSPFSLAAKNFIRLAHCTERPDLLDHAHALLATSLDDARRHPTAHLGALQALAMLENEPILAAFRGQRDSAVTRELLQFVKASYIPNLAIIREPDNDSAPSVSICARGTCYPPAGDPAGLSRILQQALPPVPDKTSRPA